MLKQDDQVKVEEDFEPTNQSESPPLAPVHTNHTQPDGRTNADRGVNDKYIQQVIEIEQQADDLYAQAVREAEQIPAAAQKEAKEIIERARQSAQEEAKMISANTKAQEESDRILAQAEDKVRRMKTSASSRTDMAVHYVLDQVAGKE
jgi:vacuolar-type H+-ATPase subunit H